MSSDRLMEIKEQDELIKQEIKDGKIPDPAEVQSSMEMQWVVTPGGNAIWASSCSN